MNTTIEAPDMTITSLEQARAIPESYWESEAGKLRDAQIVRLERDRNATSEARAQLDSILSLVKALRDARENDDETAMDKAREAILEDALEVLVRSDWVAPGAEDFPVAEFSILLATGGPACRIIGTLERGEPSFVRMEWQDWGTPWIPVSMTDDEEAAMLEYAGQFCWEC